MPKWRVIVGIAVVIAVGRWLAVLWNLRSPQDLLEQWVWGCLVVGAILFVGGARAAGAALIGSSVLSIVAYVVSRAYGGDHLETLVHGAVIFGSVGLVGFGLIGLAWRSHPPLGRSPEASALAFGTLIGGALLILRVREEAARSCSLRTGLRLTNASSPFAASCFRGFEDPWVQALLGFNVAFLALLFLVQARQVTRPWDIGGSALDRQGINSADRSILSQTPGTTSSDTLPFWSCPDGRPWSGPRRSGVLPGNVGAKHTRRLTSQRGTSG